jgi:hypothetical protein
MQADNSKNHYYQFLWRISRRQHETVRPQQTATGNGIIVEILSDVPSVEKNRVAICLRL